MTKAIEAAIEQRCTCGLSVYIGNWWREYEDGELGRNIGRQGYCNECGSQLGWDGIARPTVVLPEEPIEMWSPTEDSKKGIWIPTEEDNDAERD